MPDRSIRNVPITRRRSPMEEEYARDFSYPPPSPPRRPRFVLWGILIVVLAAALGAGLSYYFAGATVTIVPRTATLTPTQTISVANGCSQDNSCPPGSVAVAQAYTTASTTRTVSATGTQTVNTVAKGTITILNAYSANPQTLVATTRFESSSGKIYRIHQTVVVPGEKGSTPGSVTATAYADLPGPDYNTGAAQFSIPGFKGTNLYNGFSATTQGISGGASGTEPAVSSADQQKAESDMQTELKNILTTKLQAQASQGTLIIPGSLYISYSSSVVPGSAGQATIVESGEAWAGEVKTSNLAGAVASNEVQGYSGEPVDIVASSTLPVMSDVQFQPNVGISSLKFTGPITLVWQIDPAKVQAALAGKPKSDFDSLMQQFKPAAASATAALHPFWSTTFPSNPAKIKVQIQGAQ